MYHRRFNLNMTPKKPASPPAAFLMIPLQCLPACTPQQWAYQQALYQWAFAEAQQVVRPSIVERDLLGVWN